MRQTLRFIICIFLLFQLSHETIYAGAAEQPNQDDVTPLVQILHGKFSHEKRRELKQILKVLYDIHENEMDEEDAFYLLALSHSMTGVDDYTVTVGKLSILVRSCKNLADLKSLMGREYEGITSGFAGKSQKEKARQEAIDLIDAIGVSRYPYQCFFPDQNLVSVRINDLAAPDWEVYIGGSDINEVFKMPYIKISISDTGKVWNMQGLELLDCNEVDALDESQKIAIRDRTVKFMRQYVAVRDTSCKIIRVSDYSYTSTAPEPLAWVWIFVNYGNVTPYQETPTNRYANPGCLFLVGLDTGMYYSISTYCPEAALDSMLNGVPFYPPH